MAATIQPTALEERDALSKLSTTAYSAQLEDFLRDPIGFGSYDFADPITLSEFATTVHYRGLYTSAVT